jgi:DnaK suppressor protein
MSASVSTASNGTKVTHERRSVDMDRIESALQGELRQTLDRLRSLGGAVVFEDYPGALEESADGEVGGDSVSASEERELSFTVRGLLVERANRLADALDRLRSGEYGTCEACGNPIAGARLRAMPEVTTCVACQEAEEMTLTRASHARGR